MFWPPSSVLGLVVLWAGPARVVSLAFMAGLHGRVHLRRCGGETVLTHKLGALPGEAGGLLRATGVPATPAGGLFGRARCTHVPFYQVLPGNVKQAPS